MLSRICVPLFIYRLTKCIQILHKVHHMTVNNSYYEICAVNKYYVTIYTFNRNYDMVPDDH